MKYILRANYVMLANLDYIMLCNLKLYILAQPLKSKRDAAEVDAQEEISGKVTHAIWDRRIYSGPKFNKARCIWEGAFEQDHSCILLRTLQVYGQMTSTIQLPRP